MTYDRHPEIFVEGFPTNEKAKVREAVDLAKSLGLELVPFQNVSAMHDIWFGPYPYAVQDSDIFMQTLFDVFDETIDTFRPAHFHIGMDEDGATDFDEVALRDTPTHKKVILDCYEFLKRRGLTTLAWNDGINQLGKEQADIPRDVVVLPWYYGGDDFTPAKNYTDQGFRILCSPWSQWHEENDQFYSIYASSLKSDKVLGMAGTVWYPISSDPEGENDYRRCLVKAASAFWSPVQAGSYPRDKEYYAPAYSGLSGGASSAVKPIQIPAADLTGLISLVTGQDADHLKCESARERLVAAGTRIVPTLVESMAKNPAEVSPWAEGTLRRIVRDPIGDSATMLASLEAAAVAGGKLQALSLEMLGALKDHSFLEKQSPADPEVCAAMGVSGDTRYLPALAKAASTDGPARGNAILAIGKLKGLQELQALGGSWKSFSDESREAYARALAMQASEAALPVLGDLLSDANWRVRFRAAMGIGATRSPKAGPYLLKVLKDKNPAVFKIGLYWCTDTRIMAPDGYFPALISRLSLDEDPEIVKPIVHALLLMWDPSRGQWLSKAEGSVKPVDYPKLRVWNDKPLINALNALSGYKNRRLAVDSSVLLMKMGASPQKDSTVKLVNGLSVEDKRWFCIRMREDGMPEAAPVLKQLWGCKDRLVQTFILHYASRVNTTDAFRLAYDGYMDIPQTDLQFRSLALGAMASHITRVDADAKLAIPLMLDSYSKVDRENRQNFVSALSRAAGREPMSALSGDPTDVAKRLVEWKDWWAKQSK
jgi:hypothetical protein